MDIYLVGTPVQGFSLRRLRSGSVQPPTGLEALRVFFWHRDIAGNGVIKSLKSTVTNLLSTYQAQAASCKFKEPHKVEANLKTLYNSWRGLPKNKKRESATQILHEKAFLETLNQPFSIVSKCDNRNRNEEKGVKKLVQVSKDKKVPEDQVLRCRQNAADNLSDSDSSSEEGPSYALSDELAAALDRARVSDRKATFILVAAFGEHSSTVALSRSSIQRGRADSRSRICKMVKDNLDRTKQYTIHWDGKILPDYYGHDRSDRLPIVVTGRGGVEKLLCAPGLKSATGIAQASAVYDAVLDWDIKENIVAKCTDTPTSNTGEGKGSAKLFDELMGFVSLYLACRHHVLELPLGAVVEEFLGPFTNPEVKLFNTFRDSWSGIDKEQYSSGVQLKSVRDAIRDTKDEIVKFLLSQIKEVQPRDDYLELLELLLIFVGEVPPRGITFRHPGAVSRARWMMFGIYALKIFLFRKQFPLSAQESNGIRQICLYVFLVHARHWYSAPLTLSAPRLDLDLLRTLQKYSKVPSLARAANVALSKFKGHLWYLGEHLISLAFFDPEVPVTEKVDMVKSLFTRKTTTPQQLRRRKAECVSETDTLCNFVTENSCHLFHVLKIDKAFLDSHPSSWETNDLYLDGRDKCKGLTVINDCAERAVGLVKDYINTLCKAETNFQKLLQVVEYHRKKCQNFNKNKLIVANKTFTL